MLRTHIAALCLLGVGGVESMSEYAVALRHQCALGVLVVVAIPRDSVS